MKLLYKLVFCLFVFFSIPSFAYAATYYVSTTGSGTTCSQSIPCSLSSGIAKPIAGDTVLVAAGTYNQAVDDITKSGVSDSPITYEAQGKAIIRGVYIPGSYINFRGFTITDPTSDWGIRTSGDHNLIENNEITHTKQDGIWFFGSYNTFRGNYIHDILYDDSAPQTHTDCFQTWSWDWDVTNVLFENNTCINNEVVNTDNEFCYINRDTTRIKSDGTGTADIRDITFRNNVLVVYRPIWAGIGLGPVPNITIENNTIVNFGGYNDINNVAVGISDINNASIVNNLFINWGSTTGYQPYIAMAEGTTQYNIHNNDIYNYNGIPPYKQVLPGDLWMIDPKIVSLSGLDFHLQSNSPLIDAGYNLGNLVPKDIEGNTRPRGTGFDIGAYEFVSGATPTGAPSSTPTPTPTIKPGDANKDGRVDEEDYAIWLAHFGQTVSGGASVGDFNPIPDGKVDGIDYTIWLNNYGT